MRVYIPATFAQLDDLVSNHQFPARSGLGFALTPALREAYASGDDEELEDVAFHDAALASLRLLSSEVPESEPKDEATSSEPSEKAHDDLALMRRVVISIDVPDADVTLRSDLDSSVVKLKNPMVPESAVAAVHVDLPHAEEAVARAARVIDAADLGDEDAEITVGDAEDYELAWYAPEEVRFLVELSKTE